MESRRSKLVWAWAWAFGLTVAAGGCAQLMPPKTDNPEGLLADTEWQLQTLGSQGALEAAQPTLAFGQANTISGTGSCNRFTGTATVSGKSMAISPLAATRMACTPALDQQETLYFKALQQAEWFALAGSTLTIYTKAMDQPLVFFRTKPQ